MQYICDTCILIDYLRGNQNVRDVLSKDRFFGLSMSSVTDMEMMVGAFNKREVQIIKKAFADFDVIEIDEKISARARSLIEAYAKSHGLKIPDALIAATALEKQKPLYTANVSDFRFIPGIILK